MGVIEQVLDWIVHIYWVGLVEQVVYLKLFIAHISGYHVVLVFFNWTFGLLIKSLTLVLHRVAVRVVDIVSCWVSDASSVLSIHPDRLQKTLLFRCQTWKVRCLSLVDRSDFVAWMLAVLYWVLGLVRSLSMGCLWLWLWVDWSLLK